MTGFRDVYREFTGKTVEEALRNAREEFGAGLDELDFEILTPGSRGVLGMGAEPARVLAAPRSLLGGSAPKREAAAQVPLPAPSHDRDREERPRIPGARPAWRDDRGPRLPDRRPDAGQMRSAASRPPQGRPDRAPAGSSFDRDRGGDRGRRPMSPARPREDSGQRGPQPGLTAKELAEVAAARDAAPVERQESAEVTPEAIAAAKEILEQLMARLGFQVRVEIEGGETNRLNVVGEGNEKEALGALIGRKGERLSALQHLVNLLLSRRLGEWTRVLVDVEDYRGRRERQLRDLANRAAERVMTTGKMLQLEPMPALERRWIHLALREHGKVATQSIGEEPNRRVVVLPREI
ncbi:MAG TPA: RNA-binding cell elongation regulator Jag/EloR [Candidatus Limnocylindrales bacterium]|jgi:spoIIIJ-associated protein